MKVSLSLILIEDDQDQGQNVRPLVQQEIAQFELPEPDKAKDLMVRLAASLQGAVALTLVVQKISEAELREVAALRASTQKMPAAALLCQALLAGEKRSRS